MTKPIFVDTLFVVALINRRDQYHVQAIEPSEQYADRRFLSRKPSCLKSGMLCRGVGETKRPKY